MRFLLKLLVLGAICFILYYFFGPQIDTFFAGMKSTVSRVIHGQHAEHPGDSNNPEGPKYYPIEKRSQ